LLDDWNYELPKELIADRPAEQRRASRLLKVGPELVDGQFPEILDWLRPGDLLVANNTRVMAGRVYARRESGGRVELLLLGTGPGRIRCLVKPARRLKDLEVLSLEGGGIATFHRDDVIDGMFEVTLAQPALQVMDEQGELPLPPYMERRADASDTERYQTVYAGPVGAAAAPTAGLHFDQAMIQTLKDRGIGWAEVTLHVGIGTFRPLQQVDIDRGKLHSEAWVVPEETVRAIEATKAAGGRVIAVGTTSTRALESAAADGTLRAGAGWTDLFIQPGYRFHVVDGLLTNFHLPKSSLLMLVGALTGRDRLLSAYRHAVQAGYRFYSYGDAMLILPA